jgi:hypothetical protein
LEEMMRRSILVVLLLAFLLTALPGCGGGTSKDEPYKVKDPVPTGRFRKRPAD